jgi:hypothetical protein
MLYGNPKPHCSYLAVTYYLVFKEQKLAREPGELFLYRADEILSSCQ